MLSLYATLLIISFHCDWCSSCGLSRSVRYVVFRRQILSMEMGELCDHSLDLISFTDNLYSKSPVAYWLVGKRWRGTRVCYNVVVEWLTAEADSHCPIYWLLITYIDRCYVWPPGQQHLSLDGGSSEISAYIHRQIWINGIDNIFRLPLFGSELWGGWAKLAKISSRVTDLSQVTEISTWSCGVWYEWECSDINLTAVFCDWVIMDQRWSVDNRPYQLPMFWHEKTEMTKLFIHNSYMLVVANENGRRLLTERRSRLSQVRNKLILSPV